MSTLPGVASLWIGPALGWVEHLCLASFVAKNQPFTLFSYAPVGNVPDGIQIADAREIWEPTDDLAERTGASYIADIFRIHLMQESNLIWVDCDAYCLAPFLPDEAGYLVGHYHGHTEVANGVLRLPKSSPALEVLGSIWNDPSFIPTWIRPALRRRLERMPLEDRIVQRYHLKRTIIGPRALSYAMNQSGEIEKCLHERVLYPVPWEFADLFFNPYGGVEGWFREDTVSVHFYSSQIRRRHKTRNGVHPDSFAGRCATECGVGFSPATTF